MEKQTMENQVMENQAIDKQVIEKKLVPGVVFEAEFREYDANSLTERHLVRIKAKVIGMNFINHYPVRSEKFLMRPHEYYRIHVLESDNEHEYKINNDYRLQGRVLYPAITKLLYIPENADKIFNSLTFEHRRACFFERAASDFNMYLKKGCNEKTAFANVYSEIRGFFE